MSSSETVALYLARILGVWHLANETEYVDGMSWYQRVWAMCLEWSALDPKRVAAVLAVLSPRTDWARNVYLARCAYAGQRIPTMGAFSKKAESLINGGNIDRIVKGPKEHPFYLSICGPNGPAAIDRHAGDICVGRQCTNVERTNALKRGGRKDMQAAYALAAESLGVETRQVQAVTWLTWRRLHDVKARHKVVGYMSITPLHDSLHAELSEAIAVTLLSAQTELEEITGRARGDWTHSQTDTYSQFVTRTLPDSLAQVANGLTDSVRAIDPLHEEAYGVDVVRA